MDLIFHAPLSTGTLAKVRMDYLARVHEWIAIIRNEYFLETHPNNSRIHILVVSGLVWIFIDLVSGFLLGIASRLFPKGNSKNGIWDLASYG